MLRLLLSRLGVGGAHRRRLREGDCVQEDSRAAVQACVERGEVGLEVSSSVNTMPSSCSRSSSISAVAMASVPSSFDLGEVDRVAAASRLELVERRRRRPRRGLGGGLALHRAAPLRTAPARSAASQAALSARSARDREPDRLRTTFIESEFSLSLQHVAGRGISVIVGAVWKTRLPRCSEHANVAALHRTLRHGAGRPIRRLRRNLTRAASFTRLARLSGEGRMLEKSLHRQTLGISLLLLSGCDVAHNAQRDLTRLVHSDPFTASKPAPAARVASAPAKPPAAAVVDPKPEPPKAARVDRPGRLRRRRP